MTDGRSETPRFNAAVDVAHVQSHGQVALDTRASHEDSSRCQPVVLLIRFSAMHLIQIKLKARQVLSCPLLCCRPTIARKAAALRHFGPGYVGLGSKPVKLRTSKCFPVCPRKQTSLPILELLPPPALRECRHRSLACRGRFAALIADSFVIFAGKSNTHPSSPPNPSSANSSPPQIAKAAASSLEHKSARDQYSPRTPQAVPTRNERPSVKFKG